MKTHIKKESRQQIAHRLRQELWEIQRERHRNKWEITKLADRQRILKAKDIEIRDLIRSLGEPIQEALDP